MNKKKKKKSKKKKKDNDIYMSLITDKNVS